MRHSHRVTAACALLLALSSFVAEAANNTSMNTQQRMTKFGDELLEAVRDNIVASRKAVRDQLTQDINTSFSNDIRQLNPPKGFTLDRSVDAMMDALDRMYTLFPGDSTKNERSLYQKAATNTFRQETRLCTDYNKKRTLQQCYDMLMKYLEQGVKRFAQARCSDARQEMQTSLNTLFNEILNWADMPKDVDLNKQMAENVDRARKLFPVATPELQDRNGPIVTLLESAAKRIEQKARNDRKMVPK
ncbi:MAG: hypothetical protein ABSE73_07110 [Planctomycetota bacterium]